MIGRSSEGEESVAAGLLLTALRFGLVVASQTRFVTHFISCAISRVELHHVKAHPELGRLGSTFRKLIALISLLMRADASALNCITARSCDAQDLVRCIGSNSIA